jgi:hypothetical protein
LTTTFRQFIERTLYHGTIVDHEPSIRQLGLFGQMGDFQTSAGYMDKEYGPHSEDDEVVFMADKEKLGAAVTAMVHHISKKLGKGFHDVSDNDIRNHGLLCVMRDGEADRRPKYDMEEDPMVQYPRGAEPGDYYASSAKPDYFLKGAALIRMLRRNGEWPRSWGKEGYNKRDRLLQARQKVELKLRQRSVEREKDRYPLLRSQF